MKKFLSQVLEEPIEKIVQYGQKKLKVMKPRLITDEFVFSNNAKAPVSAKRSIKAQEDAGWNIIGRITETQKDVYVSGGENPEKLTIIKRIEKYDNNTPWAGDSCSRTKLIHSVGGENPHCSKLERTPYGTKYTSPSPFNLL